MSNEVKQLTPLVRLQPSDTPNSININCEPDKYRIYYTDPNGINNEIKVNTSQDFYNNKVVVTLGQLKSFFNDLDLTDVLTNSQYLSVNRSGDIVYGDTYKFPITNMPEPTVTPTITDKADLLIEAASSMDFPDTQQVHEIRDKYNVSDYIIFDDCKTKGKINKIFVGIDELPFEYDSRPISIDNSNIYFDRDKYIYVKEDYNNITDDKYGTYVDVTITYKYSVTESYYITDKVTKRIQLYDDDRITFIHHKLSGYLGLLPLAYDYNHNGSMKPSDMVDGNEAFITIDNLGIDWQVMAQIDIDPFCLVYNKHRLVVYDTGQDGVSEFYISSCIIYKVNKYEDESNQL